MANLMHILAAEEDEFEASGKSSGMTIHP